MNVLHKLFPAILHPSTTLGIAFLFLLTVRDPSAAFTLSAVEGLGVSILFFLIVLDRNPNEECDEADHKDSDAEGEHSFSLYPSPFPQPFPHHGMTLRSSLAPFHIFVASACIRIRVTPIHDAKAPRRWKTRVVSQAFTNVLHGNDSLLLKVSHKRCSQLLTDAQERLSDHVIRLPGQSLFREPRLQVSLIEHIDHDSGIFLWTKSKECTVFLPAISPLGR
jgi:hypothetical protein